MIIYLTYILINIIENWSLLFFLWRFNYFWIFSGSDNILYLGLLYYIIAISPFVYYIVHHNSMVDALMDGFMCTILIKILRVWDDDCLLLWEWHSDWCMHTCCYVYVCVDNLLYHIRMFYIEDWFEVFGCRPITLGRIWLGIEILIMVLIL